jgi:hypothetical protein
MKRVLALVLLLPLLLAGCGKVHYTPHPGSVSTFDSAAYDALLDYKAALDQVKDDYAKGKLPPESKGYINQAVAAYNTADSAWQAYHVGATGNAQQLQDAINAFAQSIADIRATFGGK